MAKECNCIFCKSKCPECGAEDIEVTYSPIFNYHNDTEDRIFISLVGESIELACSECDAWINENSQYSQDPETLDGLVDALRESLEVLENKQFEISDHGEMLSCQHVNVSKRTDNE